MLVNKKVEFLNSNEQANSSLRIQNRQKLVTGSSAIRDNSSWVANEQLMVNSKAHRCIKEVVLSAIKKFNWTGSHKNRLTHLN